MDFEILVWTVKNYFKNHGLYVTLFYLFSVKNSIYQYIIFILLKYILEFS